jgi:protein-S-isoprenylcysteine O-methyltransferase Ste14
MIAREPWLYLFFDALLLFAAYIVFRKIVRRDYLTKGKLSWPAALLQLLIFMGLMCLPYLYNPPEWAYFWDFEAASESWLGYLGFILIILGFVVAFGTMFWFGLRRAFGRQTAGLIQNGPYRWSRNPQILGGYLLVIGTVVQRPSLYALGWVLLYGIIAQMMIVTEEEYLQIQYGEAYDQYCAHVPRYLRILS